MTVLTVLLGFAGVVGLGMALYALHHLCLWLEARGLLYYKYKERESSAAGCLAAIERVIAPQSQHVIEMKEQKRPVRETDGDGQ